MRTFLNSSCCAGATLITVVKARAANIGWFPPDTEGMLVGNPGGVPLIVRIRYLLCQSKTVVPVTVSRPCPPGAGRTRLAGVKTFGWPAPPLLQSCSAHDPAVPPAHPRRLRG